MSLHRYKVEYTFCGHKNEREFTNINRAAQYVLDTMNLSPEVCRSICLSEVEYANEKRLNQHISVQADMLWNSCIFVEEDLHILAGESCASGSRFTRWGKTVNMYEYATLLRNRELYEQKQTPKQDIER